MKFATTFSGFLLIFTLCLGSAASADDESSANRLFVSSALLMKQYDAIPAHEADQYEARLEILEQVRQNLVTIIMNHPGSSLAVRLVMEDPRNSFVLEDIETKITGLKQNIDCISGMLSSRCIFQEATKTARGIEDLRGRSFALSKLAVSQTKVGDIAGASQGLRDAIESARRIQDPDRLNFALLSISTAQANVGDFTEAFKTAGGMSDQVFRNFAIGAISEAKAMAGDYEGAVETAMTLEIESVFAHTLSGIFIALAGSGDIEAARKIGSIVMMNSQKHVLWGDMVLGAVQDAEADASAVEQARVGELGRAFKIALGIENVSRLDRVLRAIASALEHPAKMKDANESLQDAIDTASKLEDEHARAVALSAIATAQANVGNIADALETTRDISSEGYVALALVAIANAQANRGDFASALQTARGISAETIRAVSFGSIATSLAMSQ